MRDRKEEWESNCSLVMCITIACINVHTPHDGHPSLNSRISELPLIPQSELACPGQPGFECDMMGKEYSISF